MSIRIGIYPRSRIAKIVVIQKRRSEYPHLIGVYDYLKGYL